MSGCNEKPVITFMSGYLNLYSKPVHTFRLYIIEPRLMIMTVLAISAALPALMDDMIVILKRDVIYLNPEFLCKTFFIKPQGIFLSAC